MIVVSCPIFELLSGRDSVYEMKQTLSTQYLIQRLTKGAMPNGCSDVSRYWNTTKTSQNLDINEGDVQVVLEQRLMEQWPA
jgi:hypothetical protein